jgi:leucyl aminopeptidase
MEIKVVAGDVTRVEAGAVMVGLFEGTKRLEGDIASIDKALGGAVSRLVCRGEIKGKLGEISVINSLGRLAAEWAVAVGLGKKKEVTLDKIRGAVAETCRHLVKKKVADIATVAYGAGVGDITLEASAQAVVEGALLGVYSFRRHITKEDEHTELEKLTLVTGNKADVKHLERGCHKGSVLAEASNLARDMVNEPANFMTPSDMAQMADKIASEYSLELTVLDKEEMQQLSMGALLGVAQGSCQPPKFIVLNYKGSKTGSIDLALVGKGITFDSGGISLKSPKKMDEMKGDMAGGASVMAAISAVARLKAKLNVMAVVPAVENLPSGSALKPGDILTAMNGKTIEIITTDAEGRLILADALCYATKLRVKAIIDVATLTGACIVALGHIATGVFGNNQPLVDRIVAAGAEAGEPMWPMPMYEEYKEQNKSDIADVKNAAERGAGAITAAQFLSEFVGDTPWVHLDIAGTSFDEKERKYLVKGATGVPVRTLVNLVLSLSRQGLK